MDVNMEQENEDVVVVAASTILLACGSQQLATKNRRKRSVWMKNWHMERHVKGAYNALLVGLPRTAMQDYKRFMRMNEETFKVSSKSTLEISVIIVNIFDDFQLSVVSTHCNTIGIKTIRHPQFGINEINYNILNQDLIHPTFNGSVHMAKKHYRRL